MADGSDWSDVMKPVRSFAELRQNAHKLGAVRLAVAGGNDTRVLEAVVTAVSEGWMSVAHISGDPDFIWKHVPGDMKGTIKCIEATSVTDCAVKAVAIVKENNADILVKGHVDSTAFLRAIVDRERGIRSGPVLSNITVAQMPSYDKLISLTDNGIVPLPNLDQKRQIIRNTSLLFRGLVIDDVKVAVIAATEKISPNLPATVDGSILREESLAGAFPGFTIDGPFGYDVAVDKTAAKIKGLDKSLVAGAADLLLFPNIEAANAVAKSWKFHGAAETGSIILGAKVPILLNSRSDAASRRINALALAMATKLN
jgi:phosphate butyryltransferase